MQQLDNYRVGEGSETVRLVVVDEAVGGRVVRGDRRLILELGLDLLGELLTKLEWKMKKDGEGEQEGSDLDTPLVKRVDIPDDSLNKDLVLVHGDEAAQGTRSQLGVQKGVGGTITGEHLVNEK